MSGVRLEANPLSSIVCSIASPSRHVDFLSIKKNALDLLSMNLVVFVSVQQIISGQAAICSQNVSK